MNAAARLIDDLNVMVAGQGGDGSLTLATLVADLFGRRGFHLYQARNVASRIKGGHAAAYLRASIVERSCLGDQFDLLVCFDREAIEEGGPHLANDGVVVFDASEGPLPSGVVPEGVTVLEIPFGRMSVRDLRRDLYKNSLAFGVVGRLLGIPDEELETALRRNLARLAGSLIEANVLALRRGLEFADGLGLRAGETPWKLDTGTPGDRVLISGNEAAAFGFLVAGGRFFAGYPITPASEILEWLARRLPEFGGIAMQAEDELAAVNLALGAAMSGTRAMTATSGPGVALMQEGISHAGSAEIPVVVIDCQRSGPSTGMPTKPEQGDIGMLVGGSTGDFPRIVLGPGDPSDAFELTARAANLAEQLQGPVYVVLDQVVSQNSATVDRFDLAAVEIDRGKLLTDLSGLEEYRRYLVTDDGISPWAVPGTSGGQNLVTGNERDEWGRVSASPANRKRMVDKRARKLETLRSHLPAGRAWGNSTATVGMLGFGMQTGVMREATDRLSEMGLVVKGFQVRTLWPVPEETFAFVQSCERVYVVEHNAGGQYRHVLAGSGVPPHRLQSILRYDGIPFRPAELVEEVLERERNLR